MASKISKSQRYLYTFDIALEAVIANKFRSMLTALGIIFGVAAVIAMMAIGSGARQEILNQIKLVGVNNIIIQPKAEGKSTGNENNNNDQNQQNNNENNKQTEKFTPGLTLKDAESIRNIIPSISKVSPEIVYQTTILKDGKSNKAKVSGVTPDYFTLFNINLQSGQTFSQQQMENGMPVCIIGPGVKTRFFTKDEALNNYIKCGDVWLKVIGVLEGKAFSKNSSETLGIDDYTNQIFVPIQTLLLRYKDRALITARDIQGGNGMVIFDGDVMVSSSGGDADVGKNQLDKIVVQVKESKDIDVTCSIIKAMLLRRHQGVEDFEIKVPEMLLKQEQKTKDIFNIVLGAIASISLIVGGIGIMNIMLASVVERTKEIGVRIALGAQKNDVVLQFLTEATLISLSGGILGIFLGIILSKLITRFADILTIISPLSVLISFGVSATVGILFGYMPARKAANQDPVSSLRYE